MPQPALIQARCGCGHEDCGAPTPVAMSLVHIDRLGEFYPPEKLEAIRQAGAEIAAIAVSMPEDVLLARRVRLWVKANTSNN